MPASRKKELRREFARLWRINVTVTHVVVGALSMVTQYLQWSLQQIGETVRTEFLHKAEPQEVVGYVMKHDSRESYIQPDGMMIYSMSTKNCLSWLSEWKSCLTYVVGGMCKFCE